MIMNKSSVILSILIAFLAISTYRIYKIYVPEHEKTLGLKDYMVAKLGFLVLPHPFPVDQVSISKLQTKLFNTDTTNTEIKNEILKESVTFVDLLVPLNELAVKIGEIYHSSNHDQSIDDRHDHHQLLRIYRAAYSSAPHSKIADSDHDVDTIVKENDSSKSINSSINNSSNNTVIVWIHGGGWIFGNLHSDHLLAVQLAHQFAEEKQENVVLVSINYRLAPEYTFPTAVFDVLSALTWIRHNIHSYEGNHSKMIVAGESAGANLALAATFLTQLPAGKIAETFSDNSLLAKENSNSKDNNNDSKDDENIHVQGLLLAYPPVATTSSYTHKTNVYANTSGFLTQHVMERMRLAYLGQTRYDRFTTNGDKRDPINDNNSNDNGNDNYNDNNVNLDSVFLYAPLEAPNFLLAQLPPIVMVLAKHDVLTHECLHLMHRIETLDCTHNDTCNNFSSRSSKNRILVYNETIHGFFGKPDVAFTGSTKAVVDSVHSMNVLID